MEVFIRRISDDGVQTLGELAINDFNGVTLFSCKTLELPFKGNARRVSCIPKSAYKVKKRYSPKYGNHFHILNVPNRDFILIHNANYWFQLLGCIAVGENHIDINKDGKKDVTNSKGTMEKLNKWLPNEFTLTIY
jgi:hypothetical protein